MSEQRTIVGIGLAVIDFLSVVEEYPRVDTKQDVAESMIQVGGPVPTALAQLAKLGHQCHLISCWGDDALGDAIESDLRQTGITHAPESRKAASRSGYSQVWIERTTGRRTSVTKRPSHDEITLTNAEGAALEQAAVLHLDGWPAQMARESAEIVKSAGGQVVLDTGAPKPGVAELLPLTDIVNAPRRFVEEFSEVNDLTTGALRLAEFGPSLVTVTDGDQGAVVISQGQAWRVGALCLPTVIDSNGAGDVFTAGLIHGALSGWPARQALRFASALAGLKCRGLGNRAALPVEEAALDIASQIEVNALSR